MGRRFAHSWSISRERSISAVVLVDGRNRGVWEYTVKRSSTSVKVRMFASPTTRVRKAIVAEAERLNDFLDTDGDALPGRNP